MSDEGLDGQSRLSRFDVLVVVHQPRDGKKKNKNWGPVGFGFKLGRLRSDISPMLSFPAWPYKSETVK